MYSWCYGFLYRVVMKLAHRYNWHYAPPCYPDGDTMLRCSWCGFSQVVKRWNDKPCIAITPKS